MKISYYILILAQLLLCSSCRSQENEDPEVKKLIEKIKKDFVFVKGGTFMMGHNQVKNASPAHEVTLDAYSLSKFETTFEEFDIYSKALNQEIVHKLHRNLPRNSPKHGAWHMNWHQARAYCKWLGKQLELPIDLATEAQWEYAARNRGQDVDHATNSGIIEGGENDNYGIDEPVGNFPPNPLGLYDMSGSKSEWVLDWYTRYDYDAKPQTNPVVLDKGERTEDREKVVRGFPTIVKTTYRRTSLDPENTGYGAGIRCACNQKMLIN